MPPPLSQPPPNANANSLNSAAISGDPYSTTGFNTTGIVLKASDNLPRLPARDGESSSPEESKETKASLTFSIWPGGWKHPTQDISCGRSSETAARPDPLNKKYAGSD